MKRNARRASAALALGIQAALLVLFLVAPLAIAQEAEEDVATGVAEEVGVPPGVSDEAIKTRLQQILDATGWFTGAELRVDEGVVFLTGQADTAEHREWATTLTKNTEGVVAAVNNMELVEVPWWDLEPAWEEVQELASKAVRNLPLIFLGLVLLGISLLVSRWASSTIRTVLGPRLSSMLLRNIIARVVAILVFLIGLFVVLRISGLTGLASTVIGGTGLAGLVLGFAFRDIAENFLASLLMSMQNPFSSGDLIKVAGFQGFVQSVNTRSTVLMTLDGNHVQIPNATVYKETIINYTANPNTRFEFIVGIGYDDAISDAQKLTREVLADHPGVASEPAPMILADALGSATVNMKVYFWVNTREFSGLKVRSAVIRSVKQAFTEAGISMPDEAREVVFPQGVPVATSPSAVQDALEEGEKEESASQESPSIHEAEGDLTSEKEEIKQQAEQSRDPEGGENLLSEEPREK